MPKKLDRIEICKISIVIPVKNNQEGIDDFFDSFYKTHTTEYFPKEIIIVDNNSQPAISIKDIFNNRGINITLTTCHKPGPAAARNFGAKKAKGDWLLFVDSDCIATAHMVTGYLMVKSNAIGYQGYVGTIGHDYLSQYYLSQAIHQPPHTVDAKGVRIPKYLVSANIMIEKESFSMVGGFNEDYIFGGEDIDLGLRLSKVGSLEYASESKVLHTFDDGLKGFVRRYIAYGKGNRLVERYHDIHLIPLPFTAKKKVIIINHFLSILQWLCLLIGYLQMHKKLKNNS